MLENYFPASGMEGKEKTELSIIRRLEEKELI